MIVRVPALAGIGEVAFSPASAAASSAQSYAGQAIDLGVYMWAGLTVAGLWWALTAGPQAKYRRSEIKKAKQRLSKARSLSRIGAA